MRSGIYIFSAVILAAIGSCVSQKWAVPSELEGQWESAVFKVSVRTEPKWMKFEFTPGAIRVVLDIESDKTASGTIGMANFSNAILDKNRGNPERTGVAYIVRCGTVGKLFPEDPLNSKEVELWLGPVAGGKMEAELRFTEGNAVFPMGGMKLLKIEGPG